MPSIDPYFFSYSLENSFTVGWSMIMADTSWATTSPTWNSLIFTWPIMPKMGISGRSLAFSTSLASWATFGVMSVDGAPVSKIRLYGPWPFTFTLTMKWPDGTRSNFTTSGGGASLVFGDG